MLTYLGNKHDSDSEKFSQYNICKIEHFTLRRQVYLWFLEFLKVEWEAGPSLVEPAASILYSFFLHVRITLLLSLACVSLSQQVSLVWCNGVCCPLFPVLSNPSWLRQMAALPQSGSARGFFLLKGSFFRTGDWSKEKFLCNLLVFLAWLLFLKSALYV